MADIFGDYMGMDRGEDPDHYEGWLAAKRAHAGGINITTHRSQGDTEWDKGWNDYIEEIERGLMCP
jgi:hypothetical protein